METILVFFMLSAISCQAQKSNFGILSYAAPEGHERIAHEGVTILQKENKATGAYCQIFIYGMKPGKGSVQEDFDYCWENLAEKPFKFSATPAMQPAAVLKGWQFLIGTAKYADNGVNTLAMQICFSGENSMQNVVILSNWDGYKKDIENFIASVDVTRDMTAANQADKTPQTHTVATKSNDLGPDNIQRKNTAAADKSTAKPELWVNRRIATSIYANPKTLVDLYLIYPNGDYFPNVPYEGLINVDRSFQPESWGRFTMQGNKGKFRNKYDEVAVTKKSAAYMEKDGYSYGFYKFLPVDGLRIEGAYTHVSSDWGKDPKLDYLNDPGCQFVIHFKKDGTFDDKGIFSTNKNNCTGGKGTYSIDNFTITFRYDDGRVVHRLFTAPPTRNPATYDETIYIGYTAHYKKNK